ncbi:MAG: hypothetical protein M1835_002064 [Candelina submexicana]|nr:MAG: hypothetical protein M1835_002064 [Candelina submexicana]
MPLIRKRRAEPEAAPSDEEASSPDSPPARRNTQTPLQRRRANSNDDEDEDEEAAYVGDEDGATQGDGTSMDQMVKKLVRLALASEYSRQPIRRADIGTKVLGANNRQFKTVFNEAQLQLRAVFGMEMTELPMREKVTISQRRGISPFSFHALQSLNMQLTSSFSLAAQKSSNPISTSKSYILTTTLPPTYRQPLVLQPSKIPTSPLESTLTGISSFIIALISLSGGSIAEAKLERYLRRANADQYTPLDKTDKVLARLMKEGYIVRLKDLSGGEEMVEYMVGPRGKVEVGDEGVGGLVRTVYGDGGEDLEGRIQRSLGLGEGKRKKGGEEVNGNGEGGGVMKRTPGRPRRQADSEEEEEESEDE